MPATTGTRSAGRLPVAVFALICAIWLTAPRAPAATGAAISDTEVLALSAKHCTMCHARKPTHESFKEAPKNVMLESDRRPAQARGR